MRSEYLQQFNLPLIFSLNKLKKPVKFNCGASLTIACRTLSCGGAPIKQVQNDKYMFNDVKNVVNTDEYRYSPTILSQNKLKNAVKLNWVPGASLTMFSSVESAGVLPVKQYVQSWRARKTQSSEPEFDQCSRLLLKQGLKFWKLWYRELQQKDGCNREVSIYYNYARVYIYNKRFVKARSTSMRFPFPACHWAH